MDQLGGFSTLPSIYNTLLQSVAVYWNIIGGWSGVAVAGGRGVAGVSGAGAGSRGGGGLWKALESSENLFGSSADMRISGPWWSRDRRDDGPMAHGPEILMCLCTLPRHPEQTELSI